MCICSMLPMASSSARARARSKAHFSISNIYIYTHGIHCQLTRPPKEAYKTTGTNEKRQKDTNNNPSTQRQETARTKQQANIQVGGIQPGPNTGRQTETDVSVHSYVSSVHQQDIYAGRRGNSETKPRQKKAACQTPRLGRTGDKQQTRESYFVATMRYGCTRECFK